MVSSDSATLASKVARVLMVDKMRWAFILRHELTTAPVTQTQLLPKARSRLIHHGLTALFDGTAAPGHLAHGVSMGSQSLNRVTGTGGVAFEYIEH